MAVADDASEAAIAAGLLERRAELEALDAALARGGSLVCIEGPAGVGKSALLTAARERAAAEGVTVLFARAAELERDVPFGTAVSLLARPLSALSAEVRARLFRGPAAAALALFGEGDGEIPRLADRTGVLVQSLRWLIESIAQTPPDGHAAGRLLLALDDAQWADEPTLRLLAHLALHLDELALSMIVAVRTGEPRDAGAELLDRVRLASHTQTLRPAPLSDDGVARLVRSAFPSVADELVQACARATGGNPFLVRELVASLRADGAAPAVRAAAEIAELAPESVVRSVLLRLGRLPESAGQLAAALAVLGDGAALNDAAALAGLDEEAAEQAADVLAGAHLLAGGEPLSFAHPLIATAVHADLPAFARARAHRQAAELLDARGAPPEIVAAHLLAARPRGDAWVVERLRHAARQALAGGNPRLAVRLLERARQEPPDAERHDPVLIEHALAEAAAGIPGADGRLTAALELIRDGGRRGEALLELARLRMANAEFAAAARAAEQALAELDPADPLAGRALVVALDAASRHPEGRLGALARFEPLVAQARAGDVPADPALQARLASRLAVGGVPADRPLAHRLAEAAFAASPLVTPDFHGIPMAFAAGAFLWTDALERCRTVTAAAREAARTRGSTIALMCALQWHAAAAYLLGQLQDAAEAARLGVELARDGWAGVLGWTSPLLAIIELERGELEAARRALAAGAHTRPDLLEHAFTLEARGRLALAEEDPAGALELFAAAGRHLAERYRIDNPAMLGWRPQAALAAARAGDSGRAVRLAADGLERARAVGLERPVGEALRAAGLVAGGEQGVGLLTEAVGRLAASPGALSHAHALVDLGAALRRSGQRAGSRDPLRRGLELAEAFGAGPLAERAREELRAAGGRRLRPREVSGTAALTPTERRIAQLAADGFSNPQIAGRLYLTTKTVEWHLGNVFRKLDIASRRQIGPALAAEASDAGA